jgi:hypothetical protein
VRDTLRAVPANGDGPLFAVCWANGWILVAGLAGGYAWCVRKVGVALVLASLVYLGSQRFRIGWRRLTVAAGVWLAGWFLAGGWLIV